MSCVEDTQSIALTVVGGVLSANVILNPDASNAASVGANGLFVSGPNETGWFPAGETWTYAAADAPTYTFTILGDKTGRYQAGQRIKLTQTTAKYFIVTAVAYDAGTGLTTVTVYGGTDYTLANAAITAPYYSVAKVPLGFPADPTKWMQSLTDATDALQSNPVQSTWYNPGSLSLTLPIGIWNVRYSGELRCALSSGTVEFEASLSTANNAESDSELSSGRWRVALAEQRVYAASRKYLTVAAKTVYYLVCRTTSANGTSLGWYAATDGVPTRIRAVSAYL